MIKLDVWMMIVTLMNGFAFGVWVYEAVTAPSLAGGAISAGLSGAWFVWCVILLIDLVLNAKVKAEDSDEKGTSL